MLKKLWGNCMIKKPKENIQLMKWTFLDWINKDKFTECENKSEEYVKGF